MITLFIVLITIGVSVYAFYNAGILEKLNFRPNLVFHNMQLHRLVTHALVHADWMHLLVNMYVLYIFGGVVEQYFAIYFGMKANLHFLQLYIGSLIFSSGYSLFKHKDNYYYSAVGASGAVMAVVFTSIFFDPWNMLYFFGVIPIPGIVFGALYLAYSYYMGRRGQDNIGHDAHLLGAIFGFLYPILVQPPLLQRFIEQLFNR